MVAGIAESVVAVDTAALAVVVDVDTVAMVAAVPRVVVYTVLALAATMLKNTYNKDTG
jgi:hypothetical protein